ncbi:MAG: hypothetical protein GWN64_16850 [Candidatus Thorarchaeota archaeon]|nr:hypothetical protein [Candidatus Thorarchaeota archaeon]
MLFKGTPKLKVFNPNKGAICAKFDQNGLFDTEDKEVQDYLKTQEYKVHPTANTIEEYWNYVKFEGVSELEELREKCKELGIKYHHKAKEEKLRALIDANGK